MLCIQYDSPVRPNAVNLSLLPLCVGLSGVIPAKAGIQSFQAFWTPASAGVTMWEAQFPLS